MAEPFLGELKIVSFSFAPKGWALCNGQFLPINQNQALFSILGTTYGGNGQTTFALPDLRGRAPCHTGASLDLGQKGGQEFHTLTQSEMPMHIHTLMASSTAANNQLPGGNVLALSPQQVYTAPANFTPMEPSSVSSIGGSQPHENRQPFLVLAIIIALQGIFPSRN